MAIISPENRITTDEERAVYVSFDSEGKCLAAVTVDKDFDMSLTRRQLEEAGGSLRRVKDSYIPIKLEEGIPIEDVKLDDVEDYLRPSEETLPQDGLSAELSLEALSARVKNGRANRANG